MLAKSYEDEAKKIDWTNCFIQPKLDGMRCLAHIKINGDVTLVSRDGKIISNMEHIMNDLSNIKQDIILDGELYSHGISFQENMKLIKKYRLNETEKVKFHVYDIITNKPFKDRKVREFIKDLNTCQEVSTYEITNKEKLDYFHSINISEGYEGSIIRWGNEGYKVNGRSSNLLKFKDFKDMDLEIFQITSNEANPLHGTPHFNLKGKAFKAGVRLSHEDREDLLTNKDQYIGKIANIRYFELTDDDIPRFPVMIGIHDDR
jgi:DNA ligase-1